MYSHEVSQSCNLQMHTMTNFYSFPTTAVIKVRVCLLSVSEAPNPRSWANISKWPDARKHKEVVISRDSPLFRQPIGRSVRTPSCTTCSEGVVSKSTVKTSGDADEWFVRQMQVLEQQGSGLTHEVRDRHCQLDKFICFRIEPCSTTRDGFLWQFMSWM